MITRFACCCLLICSFSHISAQVPALLQHQKDGACIAMNQIGSIAQKQYSGNELSIRATKDGAMLRCVFQRMNAHATTEGLWITSTADNVSSKPFRIVAKAICRQAFSPKNTLCATGSVQTVGDIVRFIRPALCEEYSVSTDGIRQDFIIETRPCGEGKLLLELALDGASAEPHGEGVRLTLADGRKIVYNRLRATDAQGKELTAEIEVSARNRLAVLLDDFAAQYPVRIDPTFSDDNWVSCGRLPGANGDVKESVIDNAGNLYIGGAFTAVSDIIANRIAKWNGNKWSALGSGMDGDVSALAVSGSNLYAGGTFTNAGGVIVSRIARWDGSKWWALGSGIKGAENCRVSALAVLGNDLYAGGVFTNAGGVWVANIAKWNGSEWSAWGTGVFASVSAIVASTNAIYVGGSFTSVGGLPISFLAKWNGSTWSPLGSGVDNSVSTLALFGKDLYVGGSFTNAGGISAKHIAKWDGSAWSALGSGVGVNTSESTVSAIAFSGGDVYVGGSFTNAGNLSVGYLSKWDGNQWSGFGEGLSSPVSTLALSNSNLYVGGRFSLAGGIPAKYIAQWNGREWSSVSPGEMNSRVKALALSGTNLYVGGSFLLAGGIPANRIAKWDGREWSALGPGLGKYDYPSVNAIAVSGTNLYAGGSFTNSGEIAINYIAKWNGSEWSQLGSGVNYPVRAIAVSGNDVYVGGDFSMVGGLPIRGIAKWDGEEWSALGSGVSGSVSAIAVSGNDVYVGGLFTKAGGITVNRIAKWDGSEWSALGAGSPGFDNVSAIAVMGSDVFAGDSSRGVHRWDGVGWHPLLSSADINALTVWQNHLYAAGTITYYGGLSNLLVWDGSRWLATGSALNDTIYALLPFGAELYVGGDFTIAGGKVSPYLAKLSAAPLADEQNITAAQNTPTPITVSGYNPYNEPLSYTIDSEPVNGVLNGNPPVLTYIPAPTFSGHDSFTFKAHNAITSSAPAVVHITVLSSSSDTDGDGLNDASEHQLSVFGFDWQLSQPAMVSNLLSHVDRAGLYTRSQVQALRLAGPVLERDSRAGLFKLKFGLERSTNSLELPSPIPATQVEVDAEGSAEIHFQGTENPAFFRLETQ